MVAHGFLALAIAIAGLSPTADEPDDDAGPVPPPWTPIEAHAGPLRCWGREYEVRGAFPDQAVSQVVRLLAAPVAFRFAGEPDPAWERGPLSARPRAASWAASALRGGSPLAARARVEYDGFWRVDVDLGRGILRGLALEIPLDSRHARYLHFVDEDHYGEPNTIALPARDGELWAGLAPFIIPELAGPEGLPDPVRTAVPGPTRELLALALLHDLGVWPIYCHAESVDAVRRAQRDFGTADARFVGYWEDGGPVEATGGALLASGWVKPGGVLLTIVNRGDAAVEAGLRLHPERVRGPLKGIVDSLTGERIAADRPTIRLPMPARGFRLLRLAIGA